MAEPKFRVGGSSLPKGSRQALDEAADVAATAPDAAPEGEFDTSTLPEFTGGGSPDDLDAELFAPTDFPNRPLTHGAAFGPGANVTRRPKLNDRQLLSRVASRIVEMRSSVPEDATLWAMRVLAGE